MPRRARPVIEDLRQPPESYVQPDARVHDEFVFARDPRYSPQLTDFASLSESLARSLATIDISGGEDARARGSAEFLTNFNEAEKNSKTLSEAFAKATAKGSVSEPENPYFITGGREAAARVLANRWYINTLQQVEDEAAASAIPGDSGVQMKTHDPTQIAQSVHESLIAGVKKDNPDLFGDPWFTNELAKQQSHLGQELLSRAAVARAEATQEATRNVVAQDFGKVLQTYQAAGSTPEAAKAVEAYITDKVYRGGIKNPNEFVAQQIEASYYQIRNSQGAEASRDFLHSATQIKVGTVPIGEGKFAETFAKLARTAAMDEEAESGRKIRQFAEKRAAFIDQFGNSDYVKQILLSSDAASALHKASELRRLIVSDPKKSGIPPEFANEAVDILDNSARKIALITNEENSSNLEDVKRLLDRGEDPTPLLKGMHGEAYLVADNMVRQYQDTRPDIEGNPLHAQFRGRFAQLERLANQLPNGESKASMLSSIESERQAFEVSANKELRNIPKDARFDAYSKTIAPKIDATLKAMTNDLATRRATADANATALRKEIYAGKDVQTKAVEARDSGLLSDSDFSVIDSINRQMSSVRSAYTDQTDADYKRLDHTINSTLLDPRNYILQSDGKSFDSALIRAGLVDVTAKMNDPMGLGFGEPKPSVVLTAKGTDTMYSIQNEVSSAMSDWFQSTPGKDAASTGALTLKAEAGKVFRKIESQVGLYLHNPKGDFQIDRTTFELKTPTAAATTETKPAFTQVTGAGNRPIMRDMMLSSVADRLKQYPEQISSIPAVPKLLRDIGDFGQNRLQGTINWLTENGQSVKAQALLDNQVSSQNLVGALVAGKIFDSDGVIPWYIREENANPDGMGNLQHPYAATWGALQLAAEDSPIAKPYFKYARNQVDTLIDRVARSTKPWAKDPDVKEQVFVNARSYLGIPVDQIMNGEYRTANSTIRASHPEWVSYQVTPLFKTEQDLISFANDETKTKALFEKLKIPFEPKAPITEQGNFKKFVEYQTLAIRRLKGN